MIVASGLRLMVAAVLIACGVACSQRRDPIILQEGMITVENQSSTAWRDVRIVVNDYFAGSPRAGG